MSEWAPRLPCVYFCYGRQSAGLSALAGFTGWRRHSETLGGCGVFCPKGQKPPRLGRSTACMRRAAASILGAGF